VAAPRKNSNDTNTAGKTPGSGSSSGNVYKLDQYRSEAKIKPFVLDTGDEQIIVNPPTGDALVQIGETPLNQTRRLISLLCGEQFEPIWKLIHNESYEVMAGLVNDMVQHFKIDQGILPGGGGASPTT
jgi:hypothetical protein